MVRSRNPNRSSRRRRNKLGSYSSDSSSYSSGARSAGSYYTTGEETRDPNIPRDETDLFAEAEDMIQRNIQSLFTVASNCGFVKRNMEQMNDRSDEGVQLDWRKPPYQSMADWTLIVRDGTSSASSASSASNGKGSGHGTQTYHLHKAVLSYGERRSQFFVKIFEDVHKSSSSDRRDAVISSSRVRSNKTTEVVLPPRAAKFVPLLLDFIYFDALDELRAEKAAALRYLANYFDVRILFSLVSSFIQKDLSPATVVIYLNEAELVKDKELVSLGVKMAIDEFNSLSKKELELIPPQVFSQIVSNPALECSSERLSERICYYIRGRVKRFGTPKNAMLNDEVFYFLTHAQILPNLSSRAAMWYLMFASEEFPTVLVDESMGGYEGSLKRRCIVAICQDWKDNLLGAIRASRRAASKAKANGNGHSHGMNDSRLFGDGDDDEEEDAEKVKGYSKLPLDIKMEILEESLLNAAVTSPTTQDKLIVRDEEEDSEEEYERHDVRETLEKNLRASSSRSPSKGRGRSSAAAAVAAESRSQLWV